MIYRRDGRKRLVKTTPELSGKGPSTVRTQGTHIVSFRILQGRVHLRSKSEQFDNSLHKVILIFI